MVGLPLPLGGKNKEATEVIRGRTPGNRNVSRTALRQEVVSEYSHSPFDLATYFFKKMANLPATNPV